MRTPTKWRMIGLFSCLIVFGLVTSIGCYYYGDSFGWPSTKEKVTLWFLSMFLFSVLLILMNFGVWSYQRSLYYQPARTDKPAVFSVLNTKKKSRTKNPIKNHLRRRYSLFWHRQVRLLLITGDEAAIEQLVPGLQENQWLEGNRTVLIYGGSLTSEPDREKYAALRKLRRGRPLDGIVRVMPQSLNLTPQVSDNDLRGLEKISELLRYSAPVWLWQLCDSNWSQTKRPEQTFRCVQKKTILPASLKGYCRNCGHRVLVRSLRTTVTTSCCAWASTSKTAVSPAGLSNLCHGCLPPSNAFRCVA